MFVFIRFYFYSRATYSSCGAIIDTVISFEYLYIIAHIIHRNYK